MPKLHFHLCVLCFLLVPCWVGAQSTSQQVDLILPPTLQTPDAPIYRGAQVKIGDTLVPIHEAPLPAGQLAAFQPDKNRVVISNGTAKDEAKTAALLQVLDALQLGAVAPAAGQE